MLIKNTTQKIKNFCLKLSQKPSLLLLIGLILGITLTGGFLYTKDTLVPFFVYKHSNVDYKPKNTTYGMYFLSNKAGKSMAQKTAPGMGGSSYPHLFDISDILRKEGLSLDGASREYSNSPDVSQYQSELEQIKNLKIDQSADQKLFKFVNPTDRIFSIFTKVQVDSSDIYQMYTFKKEPTGIKLLKISSYSGTEVQEFIDMVTKFQDKHKTKQ
jgi:hypothetical protein